LNLLEYAAILFTVMAATFVILDIMYLKALKRGEIKRVPKVKMEKIGVRVQVPNLKKKIISSKFFSNIVYDMAADLSSKLRSVGEERDALSIVTDYVYFSTVAGACTTVAAIVLFVALGNPLLLLLGATGFMILFYPYIDVRLGRMEKGRDIHNELPFFTFLAYVYQESERGLSALVQDVVAGEGALARLFKWVKVECRIIYADITIRARDFVSALIDRGKDTGSLIYRRFLEGYAYIYSEGGDLRSFLKQQLEILMEDYRSRASKYIDTAATMSEINVIVSTLFPIFVIASSIVAPSLAGGLGVMTAALVAVFFMFSTLMVRSEQPKFGTGDRLPGIGILDIVVPTVSGLVSFFASKHAWTAIGVGFAAFGIVYGVRGMAQMRFVEKVEESLPTFIRDIASFRVAGKTIPQSIEVVYAEGRYTGEFRKVLADVIAEMRKSGRIVSNTGIWVVDYVFASLNAMHELGGGTPAMISSLGSFIEDLEMEKEKVRRETFTPYILSLFAPLMFTTVITMMFAMAGLLKAVPAPGGAGSPVPSPPGFLNIEVTDVLKEIIYSIAMLSSCLGAVLASYIRHFTFKKTLLVVAVVAEMALLLYMSDPITALISRMFGFNLPR
jgi:archaellum biogenesis protein FlaJ (TadC family)